ncbi:hypothetical protein [Thermococcus sp.]
MGVIEKIRNLLRSKTEAEIQSFEDELRSRFGFEEFLYATVEGLPITGTFSSYEELSAKVPEVVKILSELEPSGNYTIIAGEKVYTLLKISSEVLMLARGEKILTADEIQELITRSRAELGI